MKAEVGWRLITVQKWPNISGFASPFAVSLTKRQHQRCSLNLSVDWDLNDWGGRWCLQQKQRNLLDGEKAIAACDPWLHFLWLRSVGLRNPHCGLAEHVLALGWPCYDFALFCHSLAKRLTLIQTTCTGIVSCLERNQSNKAQGVGSSHLFLQT